MAAAALCTYFYLPSGPVIALSLFLSLLCRALFLKESAPTRALFDTFIAAIMYLILITPYALIYFEHTDFVVGPVANVNFSDTLYTNVGIAIKEIVSLKGLQQMYAPGLSMVVYCFALIGLAGLWLGTFSRERTRETFMIGTFASRS